MPTHRVKPTDADDDETGVLRVRIMFGVFGYFRRRRVILRLTEVC